MEKDNIQRKKRRPSGCFILILLSMALFTLVAQNYRGTTEKPKIKNQDDSVVLKDETFSMYGDIYNINVNMVKGLEALSDGNISVIDYYDFLKGLKKHSLDRVKYLEGRVKRTKDDDIVKHLEPYSAIYTKFLMISDNIANNLEDPNLEVLSKTKELVTEVNILIKYVEDERFDLLTKLGFNKDEIEEILKKESEKMNLIEE